MISAISLPALDCVIVIQNCSDLPILVHSLWLIVIQNCSDLPILVHSLWQTVIQPPDHLWLPIFISSSINRFHFKNPHAKIQNLDTQAINAVSSTANPLLYTEASPCTWLVYALVSKVPCHYYNFINIHVMVQLHFVNWPISFTTGFSARDCNHQVDSHNLQLIT